MDNSYFSCVEYVSFRVWMNLCNKFHSEYNQSLLHTCFVNRIPVFVRWNNRNVYAFIYYDRDFDFYEISDFYRLARDGFPIKFILSDSDVDDLPF